MYAQKPDIEITRRNCRDGSFRTLVVVYWKPLSVWVLGKYLIKPKPKNKIDAVNKQEKK